MAAEQRKRRKNRQFGTRQSPAPGTCRYLSTEHPAEIHSSIPPRKWPATPSRPAWCAMASAESQSLPDRQDRITRFSPATGKAAASKREGGLLIDPGILPDVNSSASRTSTTIRLPAESPCFNSSSIRSINAIAPVSLRRQSPHNIFMQGGTLRHNSGKGRWRMFFRKHRNSGSGTASLHAIVFHQRPRPICAANSFFSKGTVYFESRKDASWLAMAENASASLLASLASK